MKFTTQLLLFFLGVFASSAQVYDPQSYTDRQCGQNLGSLWLDVIAVVDNSIGMTDDGLASIAANIASVFSADTRIGTNPNEPRTTRLGLVTYNAVSTTNADLNKFQSIDDVYNNVFSALGETSNTETTWLANGLGAAEELFTTQSFKTPRDHYKKVVIVYASAYKGTGALDPVPVAERLRSSGVYVITVAYDQNNDGALLEGLERIATPGMSFTNNDDAGNLIGKIQGALLQANCFCPNDWIQYRVSYADEYSYHYGSCIQPVGLDAVWRAAKIGCRGRWNNTYLASEFNQHKHDFVLSAVRNTTGFKQPLSYHIGINMASGKWVWDQPDGLKSVAVQGWTGWLPAYPTVDSASTAALNIQYSGDGEGTGWQNIKPMGAAANYVCETYSCDTDIYCEANGKKD